MVRKFFIALFWITSFNAASAQFTPDDVPGLSFWLRSDTLITLFNSGWTTQWGDISGNGNYAFNNVHEWMPGPDNATLNGYPIIGFYGPPLCNDYLDLNQELNNIRTVFWLVKEMGNADANYPRSLLGHHTATDFLRGPDKLIWDETLASPNVLDGTTRVNFQEVDGTSTVMPLDFSIMSVVTTGDVSASSITQDRMIPTNTWWGLIVELLIYDQPLTPEEVLQIETYLDERYTPPFYADVDVVIPYGVCDTTICAAPGLDNYLWSTGETSQCIIVNQSGNYMVETTDRFNRLRSDTVNVQYDGNTIPIVETICYGELVEWNLDIDPELYTILWSDGSTAAQRVFDTEGIYTVDISDQSGCSIETYIDLQVDSLSALATLGPDGPLCVGNTLGLISNNFENLTFLWSTDETSESIVITETGDYSLSITDENGCVASDEVHIDIVGIAPEISFTVSSLCEGSSTQLQAENFSSSEIVSWLWSIESQNFSGEMIVHQFATAGDFEVVLHAETAEGCFTDFADSLHLYQSPDVDFEVTNACNNIPIAFTDNSVSQEGDITNYDWTINGQNFSGTEVILILPAAGFVPATLEVLTQFGCSAQITQQVNVMPAPLAGFQYSGACQGALTAFQEEVDDTQSGPIVTYTWLFGDGTGSFQPNPNHFYANTDTYNVSLVVLAENGCRDTLIQSVAILQPPLPDFAVLNACLGQPFQLQPNITTFNDPVVAWNWSVQGIGNFGIPSPEIIFSSSGFHSVMLEVTTQNGCTNSIEQSIPVWDVPQAQFNFSPQIGNAPFSATFTNQSAGADFYQWNFGDGQTSNETNPLHVFEVDSLYNIVLTATNSYGCSDQIIIPLLVAIPVVDVLVQNLEWSPLGSANEVSTSLVNAGNIALHHLELSWKIGNDAPVVEIWNGELLPGQSQFYKFNSLFTIDQAQFDYLCVDVRILDEDIAETILDNNEVCTSLVADQFAFYPPFPNPGDDVLFIRFSSPIEDEMWVRIVDLSGRQCHYWSVPKAETGFLQFPLDISSLSDGAYILEISIGENKERQHFVKQSR